MSIFAHIICSRVIDKDELLSKIWPDTFVEEISLVKNVSVIRKILNEDSPNQYIETIPRRGYRFVPDVIDVMEVASDFKVTSSDQFSQKQRVHAITDEGRLVVSPSHKTPQPEYLNNGAGKKAGLLIIVSLLLVIVVLAVWIVKRQQTNNSVAGSISNPLNVSPLTSLQGNETQAAFSPDGKQVAFVWNESQSNHQNIYVKLVGDNSQLRLTNNQSNDTQPAWSPDGRSIVFMRSTPDTRAYYVISSLGGGERKLVDVFPYTDVEHENSTYYSPDGKLLAIADKSSSGEPLSIYLFSNDKNEKRKLAYPDSGPPLAA